MGSSASSPSAPLSPELKQAYKLTATEALKQMHRGHMTVEQYAQSLLERIRERDDAVRAWAHLDPDYIIQQARILDKVPLEKRGPLHGLPIAVKDVIYTKDMPTQHNSPLHKDDFPKLDAASVTILREAGALIFGKTTTTEFATKAHGPATRNPHDPSRTPGGSSSGSGAAVGDLQAPVALGTQTGGSTIRPGSFNGVYSFKPTWNAISREGQKVYGLILDTLGLFARSVDDIELLSEVFALKDDEESDFTDVKGARFAVCKTVVWPDAGEGTRNAMARAVELLRAHGAIVEELELPDDFDKAPEWHRTLLLSEGRVAFLSSYRVGKDKLAQSLIEHVENTDNISRRAQLEAFDGVAALRPRIDEIAGRYAAILTPSALDEATKGLECTGDAAFCSMWSALHTPVVNVPGFQGANGLPIGISLVAPRYRDRHLLKVSKAVGAIFEAEGGWQRKV
ncbi:Glutamyl-tRNA(Gln) amidotransferase subunit A 1 [Paramyrothecium foliicola]|nr:Glutamyl-tRNA(Gln) amidotransferase subunit A 1 [Paramyrothecium foliicola]